MLECLKLERYPGRNTDRRGGGCPEGGKNDSIGIIHLPSLSEIDF